MRAERIVARGFRNLGDLDLVLPPSGAVFLGPNAHGKTSLLEAIYYPVLCRSLRGAADSELARWNGPGFHLMLEFRVEAEPVRIAVEFRREGRRKRVAVGEVEVPRVSDAVGTWVAVAFLPTDLALVEGAAGERRRFLDRTLSVADRGYLEALLRYRAAMAQRNAALRSGRRDMARTFADAMADPGALIVARRVEWVERMAEPFARLCAELGETAPVSLRLRGRPELADPEAWGPAFDGALERELSRGVCLIGPQRDDLVLEAGGHPLRTTGSTGQQRTAAIALRLIERETLRQARGLEPALLLDDVFAELDRDRQDRLAERLAPGAGQVFITAPRRDELPASLVRNIALVREGMVTWSADRPQGIPA